MTIYKKIMYYLKFLVKGKRSIYKALDNEANIYIERCDKILRKHTSMLYSLMVSNISCEIYEQVIFGLKHMLQDEFWDLDTIKNMYRINMMYFYIKFNHEYFDEWGRIDEFDFVKITRLRPKERKLLKHYATLLNNNADVFELDFLKFYSKMVFRQKTLNPYAVALTGNILYNSYQGFVDDYFVYMKRTYIA